MVLSEDLVISGIKVPKGFVTNQASIPNCLWFIFEDYRKQINTCGIMHDYLYYKKLGYIYANKKFYRTLIEYGVPQYMAYKLYLATQLFCWTHYYKRRN